MTILEPGQQLLMDGLRERVGHDVGRTCPACRRVIEFRGREVVDAPSPVRYWQAEAFCPGSSVHLTGEGVCSAPYRLS